LFGGGRAGCYRSPSKGRVAAHGQPTYWGSAVKRLDKVLLCASICFSAALIGLYLVWIAIVAAVVERKRPVTPMTG
jgi:hypothetical protein